MRMIITSLRVLDARESSVGEHGATACPAGAIELMPPHMIQSPRRSVAAPGLGSAHISPLPQLAPASVPAVFQMCPNCSQQILAANFQLHELHCSRNYKKCPHCSVLLPVAELDAHIEERRGTLEVLAAALARGDAARVRAALEHDGAAAALGWSDEAGASLLHLAAAHSKDRWDLQALVEHMLSLGANVGARDSLGWTPLHTAARAGAAAACTCLLAAGADVHARGGLGVTPLEVCSGEEVRLALLHAGAELTPSRGASRAGSSRADSSEPPSEPPSGPPSGSASARGSSRGGGGVSVAGLDVSLRSAVTVDGTVRAGSFVPHPPSSRPVSSRHAQRLRAQVQGADAG